MDNPRLIIILLISGAILTAVFLGSGTTSVEGIVDFLKRAWDLGGLLKP